MADRYRRVLVTGANRGIGRAVAERVLLDHSDTYVVLACRSARKGEAARQEMCARNPAWAGRTMVVEMDTASGGSVEVRRAGRAAAWSAAPATRARAAGAPP